MSPRPPIFISAVSRELKSARQIVANTLTFLGYQPIWQDIFGTESGDLRAVLGQQIDACKGVVQLIGQCYGGESPARDEQFGRVSYTQYEALYARQHNKKVWYLFIDETFPSDAHDPETEDLRQLQAAYRRRLRSETQLFHPITTTAALEASVLKLRNDLVRLRRGVKRWAVGVIAILLFVAAVVSGILLRQTGQTAAIKEQNEGVKALIGHDQKLQQAFIRQADVEARSKQSDTELSPEQQRISAYATLEKELALPAGTLKKELPALALELYNRSDATPLIRARAAYALAKFDRAEQLGLESAQMDRNMYEAARQVEEDRRKRAIEAYELASLSAEKRFQWADARHHLQEAEKLTDRERSPEDWANIKDKIATLLIYQTQFSPAEDLLRSVIPVRIQLRGLEDRATLKSRYLLAEALYRQMKLTEAEADFRYLITLQGKLFGAEDFDTLMSCGGLARTFVDQGKFAEAEGQFREQIKGQETTLGPEHIIMLRSRVSLAVALDEQGKYAEAEAQYHEVLAIQERILPKNAPDTLVTRANLAHELVNQNKYAEAEVKFRELAELNKLVMGGDHLNTLMSRSNLALALDEQGKCAEAEATFRGLIPLYEKQLSAEHRYTLMNRHYLAKTFADCGKFAEAEKEYRDVIKRQENNRPENNPDVLETYYDFAVALRHANRLEEAKDFARKAVEGAHQVLRDGHPDTKRYEKLLVELESH